MPILHIDGYDLAVSGLSLDSRRVEQDGCFMACKGVSGDHGIAYAGEALRKGAKVVLWEVCNELGTIPSHCTVTNDAQTIDIPLIPVENLSQRISAIAADFYAHPSQHLCVIGITGTNGKSSISHLIAQALNSEESPRQCAVMGTLGYGFLKNLDSASHTTPDAVRIQQMMSAWNSAKCRYVAMEVSSHALDQHRVSGVAFDYAVFTNLTRDHLDYHQTIENYASAKEKLFHTSALKGVIINIDDAFGEKLINNVSNKLKRLAYSLNSKHPLLRKSSYYVTAENIQYQTDGVSFNIKFVSPEVSENIAITLKLIGEFNITNILACVGVLWLEGMNSEDIKQRLLNTHGITGRMQMVLHEKTDKPMVIIDYAHTPDALEKSLKAATKHSQGNICCVFGCGGDRDKGKRPLMGKVAEQYADDIVLTNDNPRCEPAEQIIRNIVHGIEYKKYHIEMDREKAIHYAISHAKPSDVVIIAGKGHENYQEINHQRIDFSDLEVCQRVLAL